MNNEDKKSQLSSPVTARFQVGTPGWGWVSLKGLLSSGWEMTRVSWSFWSNSGSVAVIVVIVSLFSSSLISTVSVGKWVNSGLRSLTFSILMINLWNENILSIKYVVESYSARISISRISALVPIICSFQKINRKLSVHVINIKINFYWWWPAEMIKFLNETVPESYMIFLLVSVSLVLMMVSQELMLHLIWLISSGSSRSRVANNELTVVSGYSGMVNVAEL